MPQRTDKGKKRNIQMDSRKYQNYYSSGSEALDVQEIPDTQVDDQRQRRQLKKQRQKQKITAIVVNIKMFLYMSVVFACAVLVMFSVSNRLYLEQTIKGLKNELKEIKDNNLSLKNAISEQMDLTYIEEVATTRLGMSKPQPYQIIDINVPQISNTVIYETEDLAENNSDGINLDSIKELLDFSNLSN